MGSCLKSKIYFYFLMILTIAFISSCVPAVNYISVRPSQPAKGSNYPIKIYKIDETPPVNRFVLGVVSTQETPVTVDCSYSAIIRYLSNKARAVGGDAIWIRQIKNPEFENLCYRRSAFVIRIIDIRNWPRISMSEMEMREYFSKNEQSLDEIEGIWNINENGITRNVQTGEQRNHNEQGRYRIAIKKDNSDPSYEYAAYILESKVPEWETGFLKARFRKTAYPSIYEGLMYLASFLDEKQNFLIDENGLLRSKFSLAELGIEYSGELMMIKAFPAFASRPGTDSGKMKDATGSAFFISPSGILATNAHVVEGAKNIEAYVSNETGSFSYKTKVLLSDSKNDVALLQIEDEKFKAYSSIPYGIVEKAEPGEKVFTIGFPLDNIMGSNYKVTDGIISARSGIADDVRYFQISVPLQPGNSGGPLFNKNGNVIGLTSARLNSRAVGVEIENVNYAIKASYLISLYNMLPNAPKLNSSSQVVSKQLEDQVRLLKNYVCLIKVKK
jgi:S1-C subfamily serine protease